MFATSPSGKTLAVIIKKMRTSLYILTVLLLVSCGQNKNNSTNELNTNKNDSIVSTLNLTESKIQFNKYLVDGMLLKGEIRLFDNDLTITEKLKIDKITLVQILEKSTKMYNIEGQMDNCEKAYFIKIKYQGKNYIVFGQDVFEINKEQKFSIQNENNEKLTLFPITNFEMGASDEDGLTDCDDYSLLILHNGKSNQYSLMKYPNNEDLRGLNTYKYAVIYHDDGGEDKIYKLSIQQDTLVVGIKSIYQEGGAVFNLKAKLLGELPETIISDRIRFETDEELKKMEGYK